MTFAGMLSFPERGNEAKLQNRVTSKVLRSYFCLLARKLSFFARECTKKYMTEQKRKLTQPKSKRASKKGPVAQVVRAHA